MKDLFDRTPRSFLLRADPPVRARTALSTLLPSNLPGSSFDRIHLRVRSQVRGRVEDPTGLAKGNGAPHGLDSDGHARIIKDDDREVDEDHMVLEMMGNQLLFSRTSTAFPIKHEAYPVPTVPDAK